MYIYIFSADQSIFFCFAPETLNSATLYCIMMLFAMLFECYCSLEYQKFQLQLPLNLVYEIDEKNNKQTKIKLNWVWVPFNIYYLIEVENRWIIYNNALKDWINNPLKWIWNKPKHQKNVFKTKYNTHSTSNSQKCWMLALASAGNIKWRVILAAGANLRF